MKGIFTSVIFFIAILLILLTNPIQACTPSPDLLAKAEYQRAHGLEIPDYEAVIREFKENKSGQHTAHSITYYSTDNDTINVLALLVEFSDHPAETPAEDFDTLLFENRQHTVANYFLDNSYDKLLISTTNLCSETGWLTAPSEYSYYVNSAYGFGEYPQNSQKLVEDLVDLADPVIDFSQYDNDGDGYVDMLVIIHSGTGAELSGSVNDLWSTNWDITPRTLDGVNIATYAVLPEYWLFSGDITCGEFCHNIGHLLGLPDLYDKDGSSRGVGRFSLMGNGSWNGSLGNTPAHLDAWSKAQLGFVTPTDITTSALNQEIPAVEYNPVIYRCWSEGIVGDEYFLVENRQKVGYDTYLPSSGLLIWHIDDAQTDNTHEYYPGHTSSGNFLVALEQADGLWEMEHNMDYGDSGDPFPGDSVNRDFTATTTPSSNNYADENSLVAITNISDSDSLMTADFSASFVVAAGDDNDNPLPYTFTLEQNHPNPFNPSTEISYSIPSAGDVNLTIYNTLGQRVITLIDYYQDAGSYDIIWDGADDSGSPVSSGIYFYKIMINNHTDCKKMILLK